VNLFEIDSNQNLLPYDGIVKYYGKIFSTSESNLIFDEIMSETAWTNDEAIIFGKHLITKRKVAWYGDRDFSYHYSGTIKRALPWTDTLLKLKSVIEIQTKDSFNSCLLNLYHNGEEGMGWHADDEKSLGLNTIIASFSLGAERKFYFRHKTKKETISIFLESGSLLVMRGETQTYWQHSVPKMRKVIRPRINLTFRRFIP